MGVLREITEQTAKILARGDAADRPGEDVVKHQRRDAEFRQRSAERLLDRAVHPAAHGVGKQHDGQDEPRRGFADVPFRLTARVVGRGSQIVQNDRGSAPKGNESKESGGSYDDARNAVAPAARSSGVDGSAAHVWVNL